MNTFMPADILIPQVDSMEKWAVIACDQFTSDPAYWSRVEQTVGEAPSTLRLILPEAELGNLEALLHGVELRNGAQIHEEVIALLGGLQGQDGAIQGAVGIGLSVSAVHMS